MSRSRSKVCVWLIDGCVNNAADRILQTEHSLSAAHSFAVIHTQLDEHLRRSATGVWKQGRRLFMSPLLRTLCVHTYPTPPAVRQVTARRLQAPLCSTAMAASPSSRQCPHSSTSTQPLSTSCQVSVHKLALGCCKLSGEAHTRNARHILPQTTCHCGTMTASDKLLSSKLDLPHLCALGLFVWRAPRVVLAATAEAVHMMVVAA